MEKTVISLIDKNPFSISRGDFLFYFQQYNYHITQKLVRFLEKAYHTNKYSMLLTSDQQQELQNLIDETTDKLADLRRRRLKLVITQEQKKSLHDYKSVLEQILNHH